MDKKGLKVKTCLVKLVLPLLEMMRKILFPGSGHPKYPFRFKAVPISFSRIKSAITQRDKDIFSLGNC